MEKDQKDMIGKIIEAFEKYAGHQAFVINNITYTYRQLSETVYKVSTLINNREDKIIGIIAEDSMETYASILAVLISGKRMSFCIQPIPDTGIERLRNSPIFI